MAAWLAREAHRTRQERLSTEQNKKKSVPPVSIFLAKPSNIGPCGRDRAVFTYISSSARKWKRLLFHFSRSTSLITNKQFKSPRTSPRAFFFATLKLLRRRACLIYSADGASFCLRGACLRPRRGPALALPPREPRRYLRWSSHISMKSSAASRRRPDAERPKVMTST